MIDPISIALGLAQFAPSIMRFFGAGEASAKVAEKVVSIATTITGKESGPEALEALAKDKEMQFAFNMAVLASNQEMEKLYLADVGNARTRDMAFIQAGTRNYRADTMYLLAVIVICLLVWAVLRSGLDEYSKGIITLVLGRFLGYLDNIYNFEFGTTRINRAKDATIESLAGGKHGQSK